jgi:hypothetical protein
LEHSQPYAQRQWTVVGSRSSMHHILFVSDFSIKCSCLHELNSYDEIKSKKLATGLETMTHAMCTSGTCALFAWLISHQPAVLFLSEQTSHQQPATSTHLSVQTSTSHQPPGKRTDSWCCVTRSVVFFSLSHPLILLKINLIYTFNFY